MRVSILLLVTWGLTSCASEPVQITADRCWSLSAGEEVQGAAILHIASPFTFHIGPKVSGGPDCPRYLIRFANEAVNHAYGEIADRQLPDDVEGGPKERTVVLLGDVIPGADRENPIIRITQLRFAKTAKTQSE
jgi:hypothetical protein